MTMKQGFPPIVDDNSRILVLGTFPGEQSLQKNEYYGNTQNHFWKVLAGIFKCDVPQDYKDKITFLKRNRIALWDIFDKAAREGSADKKITKYALNDIIGLLKKYSKIERIICNGRTAYDFFVKNFKAGCNITPQKAISTSPAAAIKLKNKINSWEKCLTLK